MADSTFTIILTVSAANQAIADTVRNDILSDYCLARGFAIYVVDGNPASGIDPTKAAAAIRGAIKEYIKNTVIDYRAQKAGNMAAAASRTTEEGRIGSQ